MEFWLRNLRFTGFTEDSFICRKCGSCFGPLKSRVFTVSVQRYGDRMRGYGEGDFGSGRKLETIRAVKLLLADRPGAEHATLTKCLCGAHHIYFGKSIYSAEALLR